LLSGGELKKRIHINQHVIKSNTKTGSREPVITVKTYKSNTRCNTVEILDESSNVVAKVVYQPDKPLSCGARVWIETSNDINCVGFSEETIYKRGKK